MGAPTPGLGMVATQLNEFAGQFGLKSTRTGREKCEQLLFACIAFSLAFQFCRGRIAGAGGVFLG